MDIVTWVITVTVQGALDPQVNETCLVILLSSSTYLEPS